MAIEPTFTIDKNLPKEGAELNNRGATNTTKEGKRVAKKKRRKKSGSSFGWGWFQGFNLFLTLYLLIIFVIFGYFMMGGEDYHEGPPKYVLDRTDEESGKVIFNPQIPESVRKSYLYVPPIDDDMVDDDSVEAFATQTIELDTIQVTSALEEEESVGGLTLLSTGDMAFEEEGQAEYHAEELVEFGRLAQSNGELVGTEGVDAYYYYQQALLLDPENEDALHGLSEIAFIYYQNAEQALIRGEYDRADQYIKVGLIVEPDNSFIQDLAAELELLRSDIMAPVDFNF